MNDLIRRAMGARQENPFSFMALLASVGGVPGQDALAVPQDRALFRDARSRINGFAAGRRYGGYDFFDLMQDHGLMPRTAEPEAAPVLRDRAFFKDARSRINGFAAGHRHDGYDFFDLMEDQGLMPRAADLANWMSEAAEQTIAQALGRPANDNGRRPRLVPPSGGVRAA